MKASVSSTGVPNPYPDRPTGRTTVARAEEEENEEDEPETPSNARGNLA